MKASGGAVTVYAFRDGLSISPFITLSAGADVVIPKGRLLVGMIGTGADFVANTKIEVSIDGGTTWRYLEDIASDNYAGTAQSQWTMFSGLLISDGVNMRIKNAGAGDVTFFMYAYVEDKAQ